MKRNEFWSFGDKKRRGTQLIASEVLVYRATISEPTPNRREHLTYHPVAKNYQFSDTRFKANASNVLYEESQIYIIESKYMKIFHNSDFTPNYFAI